MKKYIFLAVCFLCFSINAHLQIEECIHKAPSSNTSASKAFVHDYSNSFSAAEERKLSQRFSAFRNQTSNEIVFLAVDTMCGLSAWNYGVKVGNLWKVGQSDFDNGLVIIYKQKTSSERGQIGIATGRGLEGALPDGAAKLIVEQEMIPLFKQGKIVQGLEKGLNVIQEIVSGEYSFSGYKSESKKTDYSVYIPLFIFLAFVIFWLIQVGIYAKTNKISFGKALVIMSQTKGTHSGRWRRFNGGYGGFGGYRGGGGSSGGGGFGGFGGGSFGGGGASGSW